MTELRIKRPVLDGDRNVVMRETGELDECGLPITEVVEEEDGRVWKDAK